MMDIYPDYETLSRAAAELFAERAQAAVADRGRFAVALAGGDTPKRPYQMLAEAPLRERIPWDRVHIFWGDERCVPVTDERSNQRMARHAFLDRVPIPPANIHPVRGDKPADQAARDYEVTLREFSDAHPDFLDLAWLGLGKNGHTASLFPHTEALHEQLRWVVSVDPQETEVARVTMTCPVLNRARTIAFVVSGEAKADVLHRVIDGPRQPDELPAQLIEAQGGELRWLVDRAAADQ